MFVLGTGPLWVVGILNEIGWSNEDNPLGLGILAMFTFWPSLILIAAGIATVLLARRRAKDELPSGQ